MKLHVEAIYGFYHGQDPRTFSPDQESCTPEEVEAHKLAIVLRLLRHCFQLLRPPASFALHH